MAQKLKLKGETVAGIPIRVVFATTPGTWSMKPSAHVDTGSDFFYSPGKGSPSRSLFPGAWRGRRGSLLLPDAWKVRELFLSLRGERELLEFLNEVGAFLPIFRTEHSEIRWDLDSFKSWQRLFRELLVRSPATWDEFVRVLRTPGLRTQRIIAVLVEASNLTIQFQWTRKGESFERGTPHVATLKTSDVVSAILATIQVDHLRGSKFSFCARWDCRRPFEITSKHKRTYCGQYCAHLESLRRMREAQKQQRERPGAKGRGGAGGR